MNEEKSEKINGFLESLKGLDRSLILIAAAILLAVVSIIISLACLHGISKTNEAIESIAQDVQTIKENYAQLSSRIESLETTVGNTQEGLKQEAASRYFQITKQPSSVTTTLNRTDAMLFSVEVNTTVNGLTFTWQIQDPATGTWKEIIFDGDSMNAEYGLRIYTDTAKGECQLWTKYLTAAGFGNYRCRISEPTGSYIFTETVTVAQKAG